MALQDVLVFLGIKTDTKELDTVDAKMKQTIGTAQTLARAALLMKGFGVARDAVKAFVDQAGNLDVTAKRFGITTDRLQGLWHVAKLNNVQQGALDDALRTSARAAFEAANGSTAYQKRFDKLGVSIKNSNGELKDSGVLFEDIGVALSKHKNQVERTALANTIFGESGDKVNVMFADGEEAFRSSLRELERYGGGLDEHAIKKGVEAAKVLARWKIATDSLRSEIVVAFLPALNWLGERVVRAIAGIKDFAANTMFLQSSFGIGGAALVRFGGQALRALWPMARPLLFLIGKFLLLTLVIDEFFVFLMGGKTVLGDVLDSIFGEGTADRIQGDIKDITEDFKEFEKRGGTFRDVWESALNGVADAIGEFLVEGFRGARDTVESSIDSMIETVTSAASSFYEAGKAWLLSLADGIIDGAASAINAAMGVGESIKNALGLPAGGTGSAAGGGAGRSGRAGGAASRGNPKGASIRRGSLTSVGPSVRAPVSINQVNNFTIPMQQGRDGSLARTTTQQIQRATSDGLLSTANAVVAVG